MAARFFKAHGLGNDYLVFDELAFDDGPGVVLSAPAVQRICRRRRGVGADGIVVVGALPTDAAPDSPVLLRMFNPDGGEFERSGNGLRIAGAYLRLRAGSRAPPPVQTLDVSVGGDRIRLEVAGPDASGRVFDVRAEMGRVRFPTDGALRLRAGGTRLDPIPVSVGNPHAVLFGDGWATEDVDRLGPLVAVHSAFPQGTNVQFATPPVDGETEVRVWERGVGRTASSGTSACAVAAAAVRTGLASPGPARVIMEGGVMEVDVAEDWTVRLRGPVEAVCFGELAPGETVGSGANPGL